MATKKKARKLPKKTKKTARKKATPKKMVKRPKKVAKKKPAPKKAAKKKVAAKKHTRKKGASPVAQGVTLGGRGSRGEQSGDLQGLSRRESADSESVDELLEEGNAFEAEAVMGVEDADNADEKEVHTHELPEDDVPGEYLDKD